MSFRKIFILLNFKCVRSVGLWSAGVKSTESSIQNAYIQMIGAANHYIYMEVGYHIKE